VTSWKDEHGEELLFVSNKVLSFSPFRKNTCKLDCIDRTARIRVSASL
jgi:hypothetical protein